MPSAQLQCVTLGLLFALLISSNIVINSTLAGFWVEAYRKEQNVLADIRNHFTTFPAGTTILLDGTCPYKGPAVVFESNWDLAGALQATYHEPTIRADMVTPNLEVVEKGISTTLYGSLKSFYPYNDKLLVYDLQNDEAHRLPGPSSARQYFAASGSSRSENCAPGHEGLGVPVFDPLL